MLLIAQKDKEWKTSYHPCLPTTYSSTVSTHNNCFCFKCPHYCESRCEQFSDQTLLLHLLSFYTQPSMLFFGIHCFHEWNSFLLWVFPCVYYLWLDQIPHPLSILSELLQVSLYSKVHVPPLLLEQHDLISWSYVNVFMVSYGLSYYMID